MIRNTWKRWAGLGAIAFVGLVVFDSGWLYGQADNMMGATPALRNEGLAQGWEDFAKGWFLLDMAIVLVFSMLLASVIAYHPLVRGKAATIAEIEQPKTFIIYALVGALSGQVVMVNSTLAFVIFGIGGLMRFRTDVGDTKDTGRVILVTIVGLCCGLKLYVVGVLATIFGWLLIWYLERESAGKILIKGLDVEIIPQASDHYNKLLTEVGCHVIGSKKNMNKGNISFVFRAPRDLDREAIEKAIKKLPKEFQGAVDWDMA